MAEIIAFPQPPKGNGAQPLIREYFELVHPARVMARSILSVDERPSEALPDADHFLAWLYEQGFTVERLP